MKQIKTVVNGHLKTMSPFIIRDQGDVPPMLFFRFNEISKKMQKEMSETADGDFITVENGFFVPMAQRELLANQDTFLKFMGRIMASLERVKVVGELESITISLSGKASVRDKKGTPDPTEVNVFILSGIDKNGGVYTITKELKAKMGTDTIVYDLVDSDLLEDLDNDINPFLGNFFELYNDSRARIDDNLRFLGMLTDAISYKSDDPADFASALIAAAIHATVLSDSIRDGS